MIQLGNFQLNLRNFRLKDFDFKKFLETKAGKIIYVAVVTVVLSAVGSWAVLAHQDNPSTRNGKGVTASKSTSNNVTAAKNAKSAKSDATNH